jgi:hypothetical protein
MTAVDSLTVVTAAVSQALEKMAFLMVMPFDEETPPIDGEIIVTQIEFSGPKNGMIKACAGIDFAEALAENISGKTDLSEQECVDAMKELVNVACGLVLPMIASSQADVFDLTVPHLTRSQEQVHWDEFVELEDVTVLNVEGWPLAIRLEIKE